MKPPKITQEQVKKIAEVWESCSSYKDVALKVGVEEKQVIYTKSKLSALGIKLPSKNSIVSIYRPASEEIKKSFPEYIK